MRRASVYQILNMNFFLPLLFLLQLIQAAVISPIHGIAGGEINTSKPNDYTIKPISSIMGGSEFESTLSISTTTVVSAESTTPVVATPIEYENASCTIKISFKNDLLIVSSIISAIFLI